jgi:hypothetical protein
MRPATAPAADVLNGAHLVGCGFARQRPCFNFPVEEPGLGRRSAANRQGLDPDHPYSAVDREAEHVTDPYRRMGTIDDSAADP